MKIKSNILVVVTAFLAPFSFPAYGSGTCVAPDPSLVSWYRGEGDASDWSQQNDGELKGNLSFQPSVVGRGFALDGRKRDSISTSNLQMEREEFKCWMGNHI